MANRVTAAIERLKKVLPERIASGATNQAKVDALHRQLDMDLEMYVTFQEMKSLSTMEKGGLTVEEAQTVYGFLGETPEHFNKQPVAVKSVLTGLFNELLEKRLRQKGHKVA